MAEKNVDRYIERPLADRVRRGHRKVAVLEGARAVGKTMMAQKQLQEYNYVTLADDSLYRYAKDHVDEWLDSLTLPCIIDEAQRIKGLPLSVKNIVDGMSAQSPLFILTGSASINRDGLDGQDPLTGRALRYTLRPMTKRELARNARNSVVDLLWDSTPNLDYHSSMNRAELATSMEVGGFPSYALRTFPLTEDQLRMAVRADLDSLLGDTILPGQHLDRTIAESILRQVLTVPGDIYNASRISTSIGYTTTTVNRYMEIFRHRFLITYLRNLHTRPSVQTFARSKIHPIDTSYSIELLKQAGKDFRDDPVIFGHLFESFVVNQIVPEIQWSNKSFDTFYWRQPGRSPKEVDLILEHDDEFIAIEVKSNTKVQRSDFAGMVAFEEGGHKLRRGYVIYTGNEVQKFGGHMYAIPISALWEDGGFMEETGTDDYRLLSKVFPANASVSKDIEKDVDLSSNIVDRAAANIFLSYHHNDNDHLNDGIIQLMKDVQEEFNFQTGKKLNLFIDRESLNWGDDWQGRLDNEVSAANIIIPAVTPRYLQSEACRKELLAFHSRIAGKPNKRIMPLIVQSIEEMQNISRGDPVWKIVHAKQYLLSGDLRLLSVDERRKKVIQLTSALIPVIEEMNAASASASENFLGLENAREKGDSLACAASISEPEKDLETALKEFNEGFELMSTVLDKHPAPRTSSMSDYSQWASQVSKELQPSLERITSSSAAISSNWEKVYEPIQIWIGLLKEYPKGETRDTQIHEISRILQGWGNSFQATEEMRLLPMQMSIMAAFLPSLQGFADALKGVVDMLANMKSMTNSLQEQIDRLSRE